MSKIEISDEAVEAATSAISHAWDDAYYNPSAMRAALEAALPLIVADTIVRQAEVIARVEALADEWENSGQHLPLQLEECAIGLRHALKESSHDHH